MKAQDATFIENNMKTYLLGIDVGTTGTKTILFDQSGAPLRHAYRPYPTFHPRVGQSEQNPADWWQAIIDTVREVAFDCGSRVAAVSLSTQGGTLVPLDADGEPVRPAFVWNDCRFDRQRELYLKEVGPAESLYRTCGWKLGRGLPLLAVRYMRDNEPELYARCDKFLSVPSYVALKMTGNPMVDISNAGIEQFADIRAFRYDQKLLDFAGIREDRLAQIVPSGTVIGRLTKEAAEAMGLSENACLVAGAHDQYAVSLGAGAVNAGDILIGSGTCWVVTASGREEDFASGLAQSVSAVPGLWGTLRSLSSGGVCLEWLRNIILADEDGKTVDYDTINARSAYLRAAEDGLFFYPFNGTYGEALFSKGAFVGMDLAHSRFHLARAVMEGVVFQILWMMEDFKTKPSDDGLKLTGGASKSDLWPQILADVSGLPVRIPKVADLACVGAAILAGVGTGLYPTCEAGYKAFAIEEAVILPDPERNAVYKGLFEKYKKQAAVLGRSYQL